MKVSSKLLTNSVGKKLYHRPSSRKIFNLESFENFPILNKLSIIALLKDHVLNIFLASFTLRKKSLYSELFWSVFFPHLPTFGLNTEKYGACRENAEKKKTWLSEHTLSEMYKLFENFNLFSSLDFFFILYFTLIYFSLFFIVIYDSIF